MNHTGSLLMNSQPPTNSTGPITKPAVTQSSNVSSEQGVYKRLKLFKSINPMSKRVN